MVSTAVGGIPEVLPEKFIYFVEPTIDSIVVGLERAIKDILGGSRPDSWQCNSFVSHAYNWRRVAERTEAVYTRVASRKIVPLRRRVRRLWEAGRVAGPVMACVYLLCHYFILFLAWLRPL